MSSTQWETIYSDLFRDTFGIDVFEELDITDPLEVYEDIDDRVDTVIDFVINNALSDKDVKNYKLVEIRKLNEIVDIWMPLLDGEENKYAIPDTIQKISSYLDGKFLDSKYSSILKNYSGLKDALDVMEGIDEIKGGIKIFTDRKSLKMHKMFLSLYMRESFFLKNFNVLICHK